MKSDVCYSYNQRMTAEPYPALPPPPQKKNKREPLVGVKGA